MNLFRQVDKRGLEAKVARILEAARDQRRLICCSTPHAGDLPPAVSPTHAHAIIGYWPKERRVHIWNLHGNTFTPKGEPGREHGYPTRGGKFEVPLDQFVQVFSGLEWEAEIPGERAGELEILVPERAEVWIDGVRMRTENGRCRYVSMPLSPGQENYYEVTARWHENGEPVSRHQRVVLRAGERNSVIFRAE